MPRMDWDKARRRDASRTPISDSVRIPKTYQYQLTAKQVSYIRGLERRTGTTPRDLNGMSRLDASDYIRILKRRLPD